MRTTLTTRVAPGRTATAGYVADELEDDEALAELR